MLPRPQFIVLLLFAGLPYVGVPWWSELRFLGLGLIATVILTAVIDVWISPKPKSLSVERNVNDILSLGAENPVRIQFHNQGKKNITVEVHDEAPPPSTTPDLPSRVEIPAGRRRTLLYHLIPHQRGNHAFGLLFLRSNSRFGFWELTAEFKEQRDVRVYPDIRAVQRVELLARQNRLAEAGVRLSRLRGRGTDFDRLREYRREDEYRSIDWKATARQMDLVSREYVVERNQNVILLMDCGRGMCNALDGISHFDRALNAAILLAYVALRQGDSVGLLGISNRVERCVQPLRTLTSARKLVGRTYDMQARYVATDYDLMARELGRRFRKRSLVIFCTHSLDDVHMDQIQATLRRMRHPHLILTAFLRNVPLVERVETIPTSDVDAFQIAAAAGLLYRQTQQLKRLKQSRHLVVDTRPEDLSAQLINQYLEIKAKHLL